MLYELDEEMAAQAACVVSNGPVGVLGPLPPGYVFGERAAAAMRTFLNARGLGHYRIFHCESLDLYDVDYYLSDLRKAESPVPEWERSDAEVAGGETFGRLGDDKALSVIRDAGFLHLGRHDVVLGRWYWVDVRGYGIRSIWLCAAPSARHFFVLREEVERHRHRRNQGFWQIVGGSSYDEDERVARQSSAEDDLVLSAALRQRLEMDLVRFFSPEVAALYTRLGVPYRRGVLLHGPPGNGKTSLIRLAGASVPSVAAMILRPSEDFDSDGFQEVIKQWRKQAPAMLVIEDLNWLIEKVNVSTFLNLIDGIDTGTRVADATANGGLLLIATTNHPDKLDPAINNRPGRFDVVIEVSRPDASLCLEFFRRRLADLPSESVQKIARAAEGLSFAHLQEILRLSGLLVIQQGQAVRTEKDVLRAVELVRDSHTDAQRGFPIKPEMPFGLRALRDAARS